jgi:DNA-binding HxlR family transcriptional regulator
MGGLEQQVSVISHLCKSWNLIVMGGLEQQVSVISHLCKSWNLIVMGGLEQQVSDIASMQIVKSNSNGRFRTTSIRYRIYANREI